MKIAVIHTGPVTLNPIKALFKQWLPEVEMVNIVDDSLLNDVMKAGHLTEAVTSRIVRYALMAQEMGCGAILNQCSSVSEAVDAARSCLRIPYFKIDEPMAKQAVETGPRIGLVATVETTLPPSRRLIEAEARKQNRTVTVQEYLVPGALAYLMETQDQEGHNRMVFDTIQKAAGENDVVVMAQGSMAILLPLCKTLPVPVPASLEAGVRQLIPIAERQE